MSTEYPRFYIEVVKKGDKIPIDTIRGWTYETVHTGMRKAEEWIAKNNILLPRWLAHDTFYGVDPYKSARTDYIVTAEADVVIVKLARTPPEWGEVAP